MFSNENASWGQGHFHSSIFVALMNVPLRPNLQCLACRSNIFDHGSALKCVCPHTHLHGETIVFIWNMSIGPCFEKAIEYLEAFAMQGCIIIRSPFSSL